MSAFKRPASAVKGAKKAAKVAAPAEVPAQAAPEVRAKAAPEAPAPQDPATTVSVGGRPVASVMVMKNNMFTYFKRVRDGKKKRN